MGKRRYCKDCKFFKKGCTHSHNYKTVKKDSMACKKYKPVREKQWKNSSQ